MSKAQLIKKNEQKTSAWSGGTTTELTIYPENAMYKDRNFLWRLSSAVVELEESDFTRLENYNRIIMILSGQLFLSHKGQYDINLNTYEQDSFYGGWETSSKGKVTDFNLMMAKGVSGELETVSAGTIQMFKKPDSKETTALYALQDNVKIKTENEAFHLNKGDLCSFSTDSKGINTDMIIECSDSPATVLARIYY